MLSQPRSSPRWLVPPLRHLAVAGVLLIALVVRVDRAVREPIVNPDVIRFIQMAKALPGAPVQTMRDEVYHPLHAVLGGLAHGVTMQFWADDHMAWIAAMKGVGIVAAVAVTWLIIGLSRHFGAPWWAGCGAGLLWAVGRRTSAYGADGMSDMLFLALFAGAILVGVRTRLRYRPVAWFFAGVLAGLSYLTRPEGSAAVLILVVSILLYDAGVRPGSVRQQLRRNREAFPWSAAMKSCLVMCAGFVILALPYMVVIGKFTGKKPLVGADPNAVSMVSDFGPMVVERASLLGAADVLDSPMWRRLSMELWETFGFGPCIAVGGAMLLKPRLWGRRHWRMLVMVWIFMWIGLMVWLIRKSAYLDGRHTLGLVLVLHCLFALALPIWERPMRWWQGWWRRGVYWGRLPGWMRWGGWPKVMGPGALALACLPGVIMLKEPPGKDRMFIREAAEWVREHTMGDTIVAEWTGQVAFYSHREHQLWLGKPGGKAGEELLGPEEDLARGRPVVLTYIYQTDKGPAVAERVGGWERVAEFAAKGAEHGDVLVIYARGGAGIK